MLEIDGAAETLREPSRELAPTAVTDGFVPRLEEVNAVRKEGRERRRDYEVIVGAASMIDDPAPFLRVDHRASVLCDDASCAAIDDKQACPSKVAEVRPPA